MLETITPGHVFAMATALAFLVGLGLGYVLGCIASDPQEPDTTIQAKPAEDPTVSAWAAKVLEQKWAAKVLEQNNRPTITVKNPDPHLVKAYGIQEPLKLVRITELTAYRSESPTREDLIAYCTRPRIANPKPKPKTR